MRCCRQPALGVTWCYSVPDATTTGRATVRWCKTYIFTTTLYSTVSLSNRSRVNSVPLPGAATSPLLSTGYSEDTFARCILWVEQVLLRTVNHKVKLQS